MACYYSCKHPTEVCLSECSSIPPYDAPVSCGTPPANLYAWADSTCADISFSTRVFRSIWSVSNIGHDGRVAKLTDVIRNVADASRTPRVEYAFWDSQNYWQELVYFAAPGIVAGAVLLACFIPLYVARCCAHKCCRPAPGAPSKQKRKAVGCCCITFGLFTAIALALSWIPASQMTKELQ